MKPKPFDYVRAESLRHALEALRDKGEDAFVLAGGQSLVPAMNMRMAAPAVVIDINGVAGLDGIEAKGATLRLGAMCRHEAVRRSALVARHAPLLAEALAHVAHPAIRNRGTLGGSLCHADPAAELPACALALEATIHVASLQGERNVAATDFFQGIFETCLAPGEIVTAVSVPVRDAGAAQFFDEVTRRRGDYALAGLAAVARPGAGGLAGARFAFLGCGETQCLAPQLSALVAQTASPAPEEIDAALAQDLSPPDDPVTSARTRLHLAGVLARRALAHFNAGGSA